MEISYDMASLQGAFNELEPKRRLQALRGGIRKAGNQVRRVAIGKLRKSVRSDRDLERGVRLVLYKKKAAGFRVTVGTKAGNRKTGKGAAGFHTNRRGQKKPVLIWAEEGTGERSTKSATKFWRRRKRGHSTGRMPSFLFMKRTQQETAPKITEQIRSEILGNVQRIIKKYGK